MKFKDLVKVIPYDCYVDVTVWYPDTHRIIETFGSHCNYLPGRFDNMNVHHIEPFDRCDLKVYLDALVFVVEDE